MSARRITRDAAAAAVFGEIAASAHAARCLCSMLVGADDERDAAARGAEALVGLIGQLADRAAHALGAATMTDCDDWTCSPAAVAALRRLEAR